VGFINLVTMGNIYIYIYTQVVNKYQVLITCYQSGLLAFKSHSSAPLLGGFEHPGNWVCIFKIKGMKLGLIFSFSQILLCVSPRTQGSIPEFRVL
jgi:hypothetical protein